MVGMNRARGAAGVMIAAMAAVVLPAGLQAQAVPDSVRVRIDTLHVPVTRVSVDPLLAPVALSLIGRAQIQDARPGIGLDEALAGVPGLVVNNRQNFSLGSRIVMRGLGARATFGVRGIRVLSDGIPLTMPDGQTNLNNLDLGSAGAIHVLRGPASALYGNAAGGVIAVETEPAPGPFSTEARVLLGDQDAGTLTRLTRVQAKVGQTVGRGAYVASVARLDAAGYRDHSAAEQTMFNGRAAFDISPDTRLSVVLNAMDMPVAQNPGSLPHDSVRSTPRMAWPANVRTASGQDTRQVQLGGRVVHGFANGRADVGVYGITRDLENPLPFGYIQIDRAAGGVRALYEHEFGDTRPVLTAGIDVEAQRDDRREFANDGGRPTGAARRDQQDRVTTLGPFAQLRLLAGDVGLTAGARYDAVRFETIDRRGAAVDASGGSTLHAPSIMLGATYATSFGTVFGNVATSFQTPTTTELINAPPAPGEACCPAGFNQDLEPQRALSVEAGVRSDVLGWSYELVAYSMAVTDALVPYQIPEVVGREFFRNTGRTRHRGVELSAGRSVGEQLRFDAAYAFTDVRFGRDDEGDTSYEGNRVPGIPPHDLYLATAWSPPPGTLAAELRHVARQYANDANTASIDGYTIVDLRAFTQFDAGRMQVSPFVSLNNVFDVQYSGSVTVNAAFGRYHEPAPGFNVSLGASVRTGGWRR
ncbi:TonB-dependent receptor [soil metagenome]